MISNFKIPKIFKFLNQCFARLRCLKKYLEITKPTCWINSCFAGDTFLRLFLSRAKQPYLLQNATSDLQLRQ